MITNETTKENPKANIINDINEKEEEGVRIVSETSEMEKGSDEFGPQVEVIVCEGIQNSLNENALSFSSTRMFDARRLTCAMHCAPCAVQTHVSVIPLHRL